MPRSLSRECFVPGCATRKVRRKFREAYLFRAPHDPGLLAEWRKNICHPTRKFDNLCVVCETHFKAEEIERKFDQPPKLKPGAVPTEFPSRRKNFALKPSTLILTSNQVRDGKEGSNGSNHANTLCAETGELFAGQLESTPVTNGTHLPLSLDLYPSDQGPERKRIKLDAHPDVEECLFFWYVQAYKQNIPITGQILQEKAAEFAQILGHENQLFSDAWINKFKIRRGITLKKHRDDFLAKPSTSSALETTENTQTKQFDITSCYPQKDIFTVTETGLLSKLLPDEKPEEWSSKIFRSSDGEFSEERLTLMMVCNMDGTEKLPLVVVGNNEEEKDFGVAIPAVKYTKNSSSFITSEIIKNWVHGFEQKMKDDGRKIALVTENSLFGAMNEKFSYVQIFVRAPHSSKYVTLQRSKIVTSLKLRYRRALLSHILKCHKAGEDTSVSFTDSLCWLATAWLDIKPEVFVGANSQCVQGKEERGMLDDCQRMIEDVCRQRGRTKDIESFSAESYVTVDDNLCTMSILTSQEIASVFQRYNLFSKNKDRFEEANESAAFDGSLASFNDESVILSTFWADESLTSRDKSVEGVRPFSKSPNRDVPDEILISRVDSMVPKQTFSSTVNSEHLRDSPRSTISEGGSCVELSFVVENPVLHTDVGPDFIITANKELPAHQTRTTTEDAVVLQEILPDVSVNEQESGELTADYPVSGHDDVDYAHTQQLCNDRSSLLLDTRVLSEPTTSRCTPTKDCASSSGKILPLCRIPPPYVHISSNKEICSASKPTAAEAMTALMLVHSYVFSKPSVNDVVKDSFCHLVRFLSDSVVEESRPKKK